MRLNVILYYYDKENKSASVSRISAIIVQLLINQKGIVVNKIIGD